jgi:hypothetical protein
MRRSGHTSIPDPVNSNWIFNVNFDAKSRIVRSTGQEIDPLFTPIFNDAAGR